MVDGLLRFVPAIWHVSHTGVAGRHQQITGALNPKARFRAELPGWRALRGIIGMGTETLKQKMRPITKAGGV